MSQNKSETQRTLIEGSTLGVGVVLAVVLFVMVNYLSHRHYQRFDWTSAKLYTLSEKSENVVAGLDREVEAVIFLDPSSTLYAPVDELLSRYQAVNPKYFKKRVIDPAKNILEAQRLVERFSIDRQNVVVIASGDDRRVIGEYDLAEYDYSGAQFGQPPSLKELKGEQAITSAILELVEAKKPKILFTRGHGEAGIDAGSDPRSLSYAKDLLGKDNFELEEWDSAGRLEVPPDTDLVVVAGPQTNLFEPELEVLSRYLESGGRVLVFLEPVLQGEAITDLGMKTWLEGWGVEVGNDVVIDPSTQLPFYGPETIYTDQYGFHPIVEDLGKTAQRVLLQTSRSVSRATDVPEGAEVTELVRTTSVAWAETDLMSEELSAAEDERQGAIGLAVAVSLGAPDADAGEMDASDDAKTREGRLVVFGDLDFAADLQIRNGANDDLFLNTFNWLVEREQLISIESRKPPETKLEMSNDEVDGVVFWVLIFLPGAAIAAGVSVYLRRRR